MPRLVGGGGGGAVVIVVVVVVVVRGVPGKPNPNAMG